jgi:hypothetical protein
MNLMQDRRVIAVLGAVVVLLLAVVIGVFAVRSHRSKAEAISDAAAGELQIEQGLADNHANTGKPLRCFVNGQFVGMETVADCAQKNGVASQALDVGLDPATGQAPSGTLAPPVKALPVLPPQADDAPSVDTADATEAGPGGECLRYTPDGWRTAASGVTVGQCARTLFAGRCEPAGGAIYGRWGQQTLRLVTGRVEMSGDNRSFHPLISQNQDCSLPSD